jgi:predicted nuclease of predicted toxin-antitoxin system
VRFFLDENFPRKATTILEAAGHEVFDIRGTKKEGAADRIIFELAQKLQAIFLTTDKDFFHTIPMQFNRKHYGVIIIALRQPNGPAILKKFDSVLRFIQNFKLASNVILFTDNRIYTH